VEFRVLGTVEAVADGRALPLGAGRERAVLALLLRSANHVVSRDALVAQLWPGTVPEGGGSSALQAYIYRLRKALRRGGGEDLLRTCSPGYLLAVDADAVDVTRFELLVRDAARSAAEGQHAAAAEIYARALALWRGPAYQGLDELPFAVNEATRLAEARLAALEARIEADLACGRDRELIGELAALTAEHPLRERLWAVRMTALYRAGRQAEALRAYQELRALLAEELGLEPSSELRALEGAILRQELPGAATGTAESAAAPSVAAPGPDLGQGVVTFMFTDLVGSTALLDRIGDLAADDLRRRHFAALRAALAEHGGIEVKNLGDGLMTAFVSPAAAVRCAIAIQQAAAATARAEPELLGIRVGIHAGEPTVEDDDFFGTPVVIAQRLCGRADGGQVLVSALVQALVGSRANCTFEPLGGLLLKGLAVPVEAAEVRWVAPEPSVGVPLPGALTTHDALFVRPERDMARLEAAWATSRAGRRQVILLAGEPGIGKSRRSAEIARVAYEAAGTVLHGRCDDGLAVPYQPFVEALGTYVRHATEPVLGRLAGELTRLAPDLTTRFPDLPDPINADPETERHRLFDAVAAWLAAVAETAPTVLVVEDIHWASPPTLAMLRHLVRSGEPGRLLVVINYRDTALDLTPALADAVVDLLRQPDVERLRLTGLDSDGVGAYLAARSGQELDESGRRLAARLQTETAGNPFYLGELLRHLGEIGDRTPTHNRAVPDSVRDVIAQRIGRLPPATGQVLEFAAIQGERFDPAVLARAAGIPYLEVLGALDAASAARLVAETTDAVGYRFVHALVRHTIDDGLGAARRLQLHAATGTALAAQAGDGWREHAAELARHALAALTPVGASAEEVRRTLDYTRAAADRAADALAYEEAAGLLARALPLTRRVDDPPRRAAVLVALGQAQLHAGDAAHREHLKEGANLALELRDGALAARAALAVQRPVNVLGAVDPDRVDLMERVLVALGTSDGSARAGVLVTLAAELHHSTDPRRHDLARQAITVAREVDDPLCLARVLAVAGFALWQPETSTERMAIALELEALAEPLGDPVVQIDANLAVYYAAVQVCDVGRGRAALARATQLAEELGQPALRLRALLGHQNCAMLDGRFADFKRYAAEALHFGEALGNVDALGIHYADGAVACLLLGHLDAAHESLHIAWTRLRLPIQLMNPIQAWTSAEAGQPDVARALLADVGCPQLDLFPRHIYWRLGVLAALAGAAGAVGDRELADSLYPELVPFREEMAIFQVSAAGPVAHHLGVLAAVLGRHAEAQAHFAHAAAMAERTGARGVLVRTRLEWARMLLTRGGPGDETAARDLLIAAQQLAEQQGAPELAARAAQLLTSGKP
jgi:DNA-binding SARP family transcriptional activator